MTWWTSLRTLLSRPAAQGRELPRVTPLPPPDQGGWGPLRWGMSLADAGAALDRLGAGRIAGAGDWKEVQLRPGDTEHVAFLFGSAPAPALVLARLRLAFHRDALCVAEADLASTLPRWEPLPPGVDRIEAPLLRDLEAYLGPPAARDESAKPLGAVTSLEWSVGPTDVLARVGRLAYAPLGCVGILKLAARELEAARCASAAPGTPTAEPSTARDPAVATRPTGAKDRGSPSPPGDGASAQGIARAQAAFGASIFGALHDRAGNLLFSPASIFSTLAMLGCGARGETAAELCAALRLEVPLAAAQPIVGALRADLLRAQTGSDLSLAARIFLDRRFEVLPEFEASLAEHHQAAAERLALADGPAARKHINAWIAGATAGRMRDVVQAPSPGAEARLVLAGVVHFHGAWEREFKPRRTARGDFHLAGGGRVQARFMRRTGVEAYADGEGFQALELPYRGSSLAMLVVLPPTPDRLPELERELVDDGVGRWVSALRQAEVEILLPRFAFGTARDLSPALRDLGARLMFGEGADFSGITPSADVPWLDTLLHVARIEVNEQGTEAVAVTIAVARGRSAPAVPKVFRADRPFLFVIRDRTTGVPLFMGRVASPEG